jgi:hypothetical protein
VSYRVLLTNVWLSIPGGTECTVRDLAIGLLRRGHRPIVYSPTLGEFSEKIRAHGVAVIDDLRRLAEPPDIIHGHHFIQTAEALIHFPATPALNVCHAWEFWVERPAKFPQIQLYGAPSEAVRDRLVHEEAIDPEQVVLLPNAVDLNRVPPRPRPLSSTASRAICFTGGKAHILILRAACERLRIALDTLGGCADRFSATPEHELVNYDVVFATGRSVIEALCCGSAVVVCDVRSLGGLVTSKNYERFRELNFALRTLSRAVSVEAILAELKEYDHRDAAAVSSQARIDCSFEPLLDRVLEIYGRIIHSWSRDQVEASAEASRRATLNFLYDALPRKSPDTRWPWMAERGHLIRQQEHLDTDLTQERERRLTLEQQLDMANCLARQRLDEIEIANAARIESEARIAAAEAATQSAEKRAQAFEAALSAIYSSAVWQLADPVHRFIGTGPRLHKVLSLARTVVARIFSRLRRARRCARG